MILSVIAGLIIGQTLAADLPLRVRVPAEPSTLDWSVASSNFESLALLNVMEGLTELDESLQIKPRLAARWEVLEGGRLYRFHLRTDVRWTDGAPLKANQFIFAWKRLADPRTMSPYREYLVDVAEAKAVGDHQLDVRLKRPVAYFPELLSFWVTFPQREDLIVKHGAAWTNPKNLVTLGPYRLAQWERGKALRFVKNEKYGSPLESPAEVQTLVVPDGAEALSQVVSGALDVLQDASPLDMVHHHGNKSLRFLTFKYLAVHFLGFDHKSPWFKDRDARRAVAMAINRKTLVASLGRSDTVATSLVPVGLWAFDERMGVPHDLAEARKAWAGAKARSVGGEAPLRLCTIPGRLQEAAVVVKEMLERGLTAKVDLLTPSPGAVAALIKGGGCDMFLRAWGADYPDPSSFMDLLSSSANLSRTSWVNAEYDKLVKNAVDTTERSERGEYYKIAQKAAVNDEVALVPLYYPQIMALVGARVTDLYIDPLQYLLFKRVRIK